ncbi:N-6 DNA methylase [Spiroplasma citri]|uniref:site-specific DNA-methyltransferase (adenine-specific) n=1 Tax=Spiroplasma citri TaxID=2133 RepID=A0AAJ4EJU4_SPICI|nr:N-6 DNA methylase [Spiroplasma citri]APE75104.1 N-6 adenine specific DNA methyltransferase [Spiroplasma citri]QED25007.1 N-6 DNA methylase [Spiroplasma citri]QIA69212.1 N-6 DNA methylase [Spiroplasma citri]QIA71078.1 N-6 DNA methylase [Spiroplasma citri]QIA73124.1 N-6 DNA methylase [Spiroplasma citri]
MANERITENIVRDKLQRLNYYSNNDIVIDEQISSNEKIKDLLKFSSKQGIGNGKPEFIIWHKTKELVIIIECKSLSKFHISENLDSPKEYAVDGALHYARNLKDNYNVIALGVSGQSLDDIKISAYSWLKNDKRYIPRKFNDLVSFDEYLSIFEISKKPISENELIKYSRELHNAMRDEAKLKETEKPLLVSALLLALDNDGFRAQYKSILDGNILARTIIIFIEEALKNSNLDNTKISVLKREFEGVVNKQELLNGKIVLTDSSYNNLLFKFLSDLEEKVYPFMKEIRNIDLVGKFYSEFVRYTGGDGKGLGIVLTPKHITTLFAKLADVNYKSTVLDICVGTGGFLIAALEKMFNDKSKDLSVEEINSIYSKKLIGYESQDDIFALACSNMIIRGDGKTNLFCKNSLLENSKDINKKFNTNVGLINPPYSQKKEDEKELKFVLHMLDSLSKGGIGVAIVPVSTILSTNKKATNTLLKQKILENHKLEAVISMPEELFYPTATVTCILVFRAWEKNDKTILYSLKDDGFKKVKYIGRMDMGNWEKIEKTCLDAIKNKDVSNNFTTKLLELKYYDEWLPEAYIDSNYTKLSKKHFIRTIKEYATFLFNSEQIKVASADSLINEKYEINFDDWRFFNLGDENIFLINRAKGVKVNDYEEGNKIPFVTTTSSNNGIIKYVDEQEINDLNCKNVITIANNGSVGESFYQNSDFLATSDVTILKTIKYKMNPFLAMFLCTMIKWEKFRFNYGRKWGIDRMKQSYIFLPSIKVDDQYVPDFEYMELFIKSLIYSKHII